MNGKNVSTKTELGFATIEREWKKGDKVLLELPMPLRLNKCDSRVEENHNRLAFTRGPFVLCAESIDNEGATQRFYLDSKPSISKVNFSKVVLPVGSFLKATTHTNALTENGESEKETYPLFPTMHGITANRAP